MADKLEDLEQKTFEEDDYSEVPPDDIVAYNELRDYGRNFRKMLVNLIGLVNLERLEGAVDQAKKDQLEAALSSLKTVRNAQAHTHIRGVTATINAPSWTIAQFTPVYDGLIEFDKWLRDTPL